MNEIEEYFEGRKIPVKTHITERPNVIYLQFIDLKKTYASYVKKQVKEIERMMINGTSHINPKGFLNE